MKHSTLIACHACDLLQREVALPPGGKAICPRCKATLYTHSTYSIDRVLALMLAAALLFAIGNVFPVVSMEIQGQRTEALVWEGAWRLHQEGESLVGVLVFLTVFVFPLVQIVGLLAIPVMLNYDYSKSLISGTICAGGSLGTIIPPSVIVVILGPAADV